MRYGKEEREKTGASCRESRWKTGHGERQTWHQGWYLPGTRGEASKRKGPACGPGKQPGARRVLPRRDRGEGCAPCSVIERSVRGQRETDGCALCRKETQKDGVTGSGRRDESASRVVRQLASTRKLRMHSLALALASPALACQIITGKKT
jgi:hypothetical protein